MSEEERKYLGRNAMRIVFEHIANRVVLALEGRSQQLNTPSISKSGAQRWCSFECIPETYP